MAKQKEIKVDYMMKRAVSRGAMKIENYKSRWFVLDSDNLKYYGGSLERRTREKGSIPISNIRAVEAVDEGMLDDKKFAFQVVYADKSNFYTLYVVALNDDQRKQWIEEIKKAAKAKDVPFLQKYHPGVWTKTLNRYNCCDQIDRNAPGCVLATEKERGPPPESIRNQGRIKLPPSIPSPTPPEGRNNGIQKEKKFYVAAYDYKPAEDGDLELITGDEYEILDDTRDHWWLAKNRKGDKGYVPSNYVKKKFDLESYEWYYKGVTRERSEATLKADGKDGCFMVRDSSTPGMYTISIFCGEGGGMVRHYHIKKSSDDKFYLAEKHQFATIPELVYYHKHNSGGIATRLRNPPIRNKNAPVTAGFGSSKWEINRDELEIFEMLGAGCFGTVHKGTWKGRVVAVKMTKENTMSEESFIEEARTMTQLSHDNLVQLYGVVTKTKPLIIVTEFMPYGSLLTYLKRHRARILSKVATLTDMCLQVCSAMVYLEQRGFIHRDLAARNCLVGENQVIKVADFGLARYVLDNEYISSQGAKFPVKWAPPEVLSYTRFSTKSDVWAYGVLMWEIFSGGQMPYDNMRNADVVDYVCHLNKRLEKPNASPEKLYSLMIECWHKDPDPRPSFKEIHKKLSGLLEVGNYPSIS
ncbi:hypothetical protein ACJMK2_030838 [Sinanodonta woodiana]|uniref:Tyrosine-protein kinase n=1 Tax=Sinanodonta woodiana TaxID=1069815 RepID=A0ABD3WZ02_SINWO